jgi:hypothetical protein
MSVINIHEEFYPAGYPLLVPRFVVFAILEREKEDPATPDTRLTIRLEDEVVFDEAVEVNFGIGQVTRVIAQFQGFVLPRPGVLRVSLSVGEIILESYRISAFPVGTPKPQVIA